MVPNRQVCSLRWTGWSAGRARSSAVQEVRDAFAIPVIAIATLDDLMRFIAGEPALTAYGSAVAAYRAQYGVG